MRGRKCLHKYIQSRNLNIYPPRLALSLENDSFNLCMIKKKKTLTEKAIANKYKYVTNIPFGEHREVDRFYSQKMSFSPLHLKR